MTTRSTDPIVEQNEETQAKSHAYRGVVESLLLLDLDGDQARRVARAIANGEVNYVNMQF